MKTMKLLDSLYIIGALNDCFNDWYKPSKVEFELYHLTDDPFELDNIIENPKYATTIGLIKYAIENNEILIDNDEESIFSSIKNILKKWKNKF